MADINIQKRRPSLWPWIAGLALLIALIYGAAHLMEGSTLGGVRVDSIGTR
jgi:hypothetical protein